MFLRTSDYPAILRRIEVLKIIFISDLVLILGLAPLGVEPQQNALAEQNTVVVLLESHVINTSRINRKYLPVRFNLQFQFRSHIQTNHIQEPVQSFLAAIQYHHIVHIPVVVFHAQNLLDEVIQVGQVQVRQVLACEVSDRQTLIAAVAVNNGVQQPEHIGIGNGVADYPFQRCVIHVVIELADVYLKTVPRPHSVKHQGPVYIFHALVDSAPLDTGIGVLNEDMLPVLPKNHYHIVVNDSVRKERCNHKHPFLGVVNRANSVLTWNIGLVVQHLPQLLLLIRDMFIERTDFLTILFAFLRVVRCLAQPLRIIEKVVEPFELCALALYQLPRALHIDICRHPVGIVYVLEAMGIAPPQPPGEIAIVPLAQIRAFNLLTHTDSTLAFFYQLPAVASSSCEVWSVGVC